MTRLTDRLLDSASFKRRKPTANTKRKLPLEKSGNATIRRSVTTMIVPSLFSCTEVQLSCASILARLSISWLATS